MFCPFTPRLIAEQIVLSSAQPFQIVTLPGERSNSYVERIAQVLGRMFPTGLLPEKRLSDIAAMGKRTLCLITAQTASGLSQIADALLPETASISQSFDSVVLLGIDDGSTSDSRVLGMCVPVLEPADHEEFAHMLEAAFSLSYEFNIPILLRLVIWDITRKTTEIVRAAPVNTQAVANIFLSTALHHAREIELANHVDHSPWNVLERGQAKPRHQGFIVSGPLCSVVKKAFPKSPFLRIGFSSPLPLKKTRGLIASCEQAFVIETGAPIIENQILAEGYKICGQSKLRATGLWERILQSADLVG